MTTTAPDVLAAARGLADDVLFPDAMRVDGLDAIPAAHLDARARRGVLVELEADHADQPPV